MSPSHAAAVHFLARRGGLRVAQAAAVLRALPEAEAALFARAAERAEEQLLEAEAGQRRAARVLAGVAIVSDVGACAVEQ